MEENFEIEMQKLRDADPSATLQFSPSMSQNFVAPARVSSRRLIIGLLAIAVFAVPGYFSIFQNSGGGDNSSESAPDRLIELPRRATALSTTTTSTTTIPPFEFSENENIFVMTGTEGDVMQEVAPEGKVYTEVLFASYGNPTVTDGKLEQGSCHAENSMQIVAEAFVGKTNGVLTFDEATFGDPCVGTRKTFAVVLEYGDDPSPTTTTTVPETTTTTAVPETTTTLAPVTTTTLPENVAITLTGSRFYGESDSAIVWELACEGSAALCDWAKVRCEGNTLNISVSGTEVSDTAYTGSISLGDGGVPKPANVNFSGIASLTVMPRPVIVTPDSGLSKTYDAADPTLTYTTLGLISGDSLSGSLTRVVGENVGTYAISQGSVTTANNSNYTVTFSGTPVDFTIDELAVVVTPDSAQSKTYGAADPTFTYSVSPALVGTDSLTGALSRVTGSNVGTYAITLGTLANSNYTVTLSGTPVDFTINKLAVTVTPDSAQSKTYGAADPTFTYSVSPALVGTDSLTGALDREDGDDVGTYELDLGDLANSNYTVTLSGTPVDFTINKKPVTVTPDSAQSKTYGAADPTFTYSTSPALVGTDSLTGALSRVTGSDVGTYAMTQGTVTTANNSNYTVTFSGTPVNFTINKLAVTVTADAKSKTYGSDDPTLTYTTSPSSISLSGALSRATGENVGSYAMTQGTVTTANNSNYTITFVGANLTISQRAVTVTADAKSKTYGDADPGLTYQLTGSLKSGDAFSGALTRVAGENAGEYNITQGSVALNSNYNITFVGAKLTISTRAVTVTADAKSKDFGGVDPALTYTLTSGSLKSGDSFTGALTRTAGENAGQYDITQGNVALNSNYTITFVGAKFTINGVTVTVTPVSGQQAEIGSGYKVQLVVTGLLGTDTYSGDAAYTDALGDQAITVGTLAVGSNYSLSFTPGVTVKVVAQLPISVTWRARNGSVNATGQASIGAKVEVTATGGGTGALTWSSTGGGCSLSVVDAITQTIQKNGNGTCTVTVRRAASSGRAASEVSQTFTWSNK